MGVTAHYIRLGEPKLVKVTLSCKEFRGSHTGERNAEHLEAVMQNFGIEDTALALTTDTAANAKKAGTKCPPQLYWQGCGCHILHLCALKILNQSDVKRTFVKHSKVARHLHKSTASADRLGAMQDVRYS